MVRGSIYHCSLKLLLTTASGLHQGLVYLFWLFPVLRCSITVFLSAFFGNGAFLSTKLLQTDTVGSSLEIFVFCIFQDWAATPGVLVPLLGKLHSSEPPCNIDIVKNWHSLGFRCFLLSEVIGFEADCCSNWVAFELGVCCGLVLLSTCTAPRSLSHSAAGYGGDQEE